MTCVTVTLIAYLVSRVAMPPRRRARGEKQNTKDNASVVDGPADASARNVR